ncbi:hypothetical protein [Streptomyces noursei]|uniref:hypothetical protein n=1 Tax=Streptomyces noursei TaxID=1971 RepID=UPI0019C009C8|nr:hypothetical protein [Streptomyces noursei]MCZ1017230.1 hypothetical protein [Streptomyces noursei]GGX11630.1 hypothetical protein GCM10010341_36580 [Streptomyces noursei]
MVSVNTERVKTAAVTAALAGWLAATAVAQIPEQRFDGLLSRGKLRIPTPNWRFFGPNPGTKDNHLLYRDITDGKPGEWTEIPITRDRPWYALAWNARNRSPKALFDASQHVLAQAVAFGSAVLPVTTASGYRLLARYIQLHLPHTDGASHSQFMLLHSYPTSPEDRHIDPVFVSMEFPLEGDVTPAMAPSLAAA